MTTYYVRKTGADAAAGTSAGAAWLTIGKALGAAGIASGDTVYIGAGTYREVVTVAMTSATVETFVIGDVDGVKTGDAGEVIWTAYTTNDSTAPSSSSLLTTNARDFLTFQRLTMVGGSAIYLIDVSIGSVSIKLQDCLVLGNAGSGGTILIGHETTFGVAANITIERCLLRAGRSTAIIITLATGTGSDYDANVVIRNCLVQAWANGDCIRITSSGAGSQEGGGVYVYNNSLIGQANNSSGGVSTQTTKVGGSTFTFPAQVRNNVVVGGLSAGESGALVENYNHVVAATTHTNVTAGANTITNLNRAMLLSFGQERQIGSQPRPWGEPMTGSPYLGFGNDGTYTSAEDIRGDPRPAGGATATKGIGAYERGNTFAKETGTVRTGSNAISITGPGYQDFQLPVAASSTTVTVYVRWDATYAGTKPKMQVLNGTEAGVADATATATGSSGAWEQLSLNFTPTSAGIVTIRLLSSDTNGGGKMFADDFAVA